MNFSKDDLDKIFLWFWVGLFTGLPLILGALLGLFAARKRTQIAAQINSAAPSKIFYLQAGSRSVRLDGIITEVPKRIDGPDESPLALVRLQVMTPTYDEAGYRSDDRIRCVPFKVQDETGSIWVNPTGLEKMWMGEGRLPADPGIAEAAAIQTGVRAYLHGRGTNIRMWELRGGQRITIVGIVSQSEGGLVVKKIKKNPLIVTTLLGNTAKAGPQKLTKSDWKVAAFFGIPGVLILLTGLGAMVVNLISVLQRP